MKKCKNCGDVQDQGKFCGKCGGELHDHQGEVISKSSKKKTGLILLGIIVSIVLVVSSVFAFQVLGNSSNENEIEAQETEEAAENDTLNPAVDMDDDVVDDSDDEIVVADDEVAADDEQSNEANVIEPVYGLFVPVVEQVTSSSYLIEETSNGSIISGPTNLFDGDTKTAWAEGITGTGTGESIIIPSQETSIVESMTFLNGYTKSADLYDWNDRIKTIRIEFSDGTYEDYLLEDTFLDYQAIVFDKPVVTDYIKLTIIEVYEGSRYADCCLTEIKIN